MRYYAGNWAPSVWLFRRGTMERLDECITDIGAALSLHLIEILLGRLDARGILDHWLFGEGAH
jgi:hypothetical protein